MSVLLGQISSRGSERIGYGDDCRKGVTNEIWLQHNVFVVTVFYGHGRILPRCGGERK